MRSVTQAIACASLILAASHASAAVINLEPPNRPTLGNVYSQDGYTFTNSNSGSDAYVNWLAYGIQAYDADYPGATILQNYSPTTNTLTKTAGGSFFFGGISLADGYNSDKGGSVDFTFNYANGTSSSTVVTLAKRTGLQAFAFNQAGVTSVVFNSDATHPTDYLQFDYVAVGSVSAVPLPASLPMFGGALLALGGLGFGMSRRNGRRAATAA